MTGKGREFGTVGARPPPIRITSSHLANRMAGALRRRFGEERFGLDGRLRNPRDALLPEAAHWLNGAEQREGEALRLPWSARALLLNSFAPWRQAPGKLRLAGIDGFRRLAFDVRCPTGVRGTPPVVGLLASAPGEVLGVVATGVEAYARRPRALAPSYARMAAQDRPAGWGRAAAAGDWRHLDCAVLFRVALALRFTFPDARCRVLYLHLEPADAARLEPCLHHHRELERLARTVADAEVGFVHLSFNQLWRQWCQDDVPVFAARLGAALAARYVVAVG